jgi:hypothetical protein
MFEHHAIEVYRGREVKTTRYIILNRRTSAYVRKGNVKMDHKHANPARNGDEYKLLTWR